VNVKRFAKVTAAIAVAALLGALCASPASAESIGLIRSVVISMLGGQVNGSGATTGQALVKKADGSWGPGSVGASFPLLAPDGSTAAPSYAFSSNNSTGMFLTNGGTTIRFAANNTIAADLGPASGDQQFYGRLVVAPGSPSARQAAILSNTNNANSGTGTGVTVQPIFLDAGLTSTTVAQGLWVNPQINYTGSSRTGHYEGITVTVTEVSPPTGGSVPNYLLLLQNTGVTVNSGAPTANEVASFRSDGSLRLGYTTSQIQALTTCAGTPSATNPGGLTAYNYNSDASNGDSRGHVAIDDYNAFAAGVGGGIIFRGNYNTSTFGVLASLKGVKENATGGDNTGALCFTTQQNGSTGLERARFLGSSSTFQLRSDAILAFTSGAASAAADTGWSRGAAGELDAGTGAQGSKAGFVVASGFSVGNGTPVKTAGTLAWVAGLGAKTASAAHVVGPTDQSFFISAGTPAASQAGRAVTITASSADTAATNNGGNVLLSGGSGDNTGTPVAGCSLSVGGGVGTLSKGGAGSFTGGTSLSGASGPSITITAGSGNNGASKGAVITLNGGSTATTGGVLSLSGGDGSGQTDSAAGGATLTSGLPNGTGTADVAVQTGFALASGTTAQTAYDRFRVTSKTKALSTTTATNTVFALLSNAVTDSGVGCTITGTIELIDGTHHVGTIHFTVPFSSVNQNGTLTAGVVPVLGTGNGSIDTGGTYTSLTTTFTAVVSGTNLQLGVTPTWSAGTPTTARLTYQVQANGQVTVAPQ
jgi:hypothetical protein